MSHELYEKYKTILEIIEDNKHDINKAKAEVQLYKDRYDVTSEGSQTQALSSVLETEGEEEEEEEDKTIQRQRNKQELDKLKQVVENIKKRRIRMIDAKFINDKTHAPQYRKEIEYINYIFDKMNYLMKKYKYKYTSEMISFMRDILSALATHDDPAIESYLFNFEERHPLTEQKRTFVKSSTMEESKESSIALRQSNMNKYRELRKKSLLNFTRSKNISNNTQQVLNIIVENQIGRASIIKEEREGYNAIINQLDQTIPIPVETLQQLEDKYMYEDANYYNSLQEYYKLVDELRKFVFDLEYHCQLFEYGLYEHRQQTNELYIQFCTDVTETHKRELEQKRKNWSNITK